MSAASPEQPRDADPDRPSSLTELTEQTELTALTARAFEQSPVPWMLCDVSGRLLRINEAMAGLGGFVEAELRGRLPTELQDGTSGPLDHIDASVFEESARLIQEVASTGVPQTLETYVRPPGQPGAHAWAVSYTPVRDADGRLDAVAVTAVDFTEQFTARQRLALLNAAAERIGATLDVGRTAQDLAEVIVPGFADFASVDLLDGVFHGDEPAAGPLSGAVLLRRAAQAWTGASGAPGSGSARGSGSGAGVVEVGERGTYPVGSPPALCLANGRSGAYTAGDPALVEWFAQDEARAAWASDHELVSLLAVPIVSRETTLGVAVFSRLSAAAEPFSPEELSLAEEIVARAAACLDNARRYTRERTTALTLQHSLLQQRAPSQAAAEVATRYLPASAQAGIGGDWFDVIPLSGTRIALVVGDVTGHGLHASVTMGRLRTAVRTLADVDLPPDELLSHLDDLVISLNAEAHAAAEASAAEAAEAAEAQAAAGESEAPGTDVGGADGGGADGAGDIGATCLYAVYDPISRHCALARAGHPVPALRTPDGQVEFLDVPAGPPLGLGGLAFETVEVELPVGSLLALYTDGLVESRYRDIDQGLAALRRSLAVAGPSLDDACDQVLAALTTQRPEDDVALLLARTRGLGADQVADWEVPPDPAFVSEARRLASRQLAVWGLEELVFVTELVVSELVTNAIRYGRSPMRLRLIRDSALTCEVSDASGTAPHLRRARTFEEGGRGLMLVAQCSTRWGTRHSPAGKTIWAEQALPPSS
ncbi:serine phosphatase RsbU (regulator of sigma subunit)/anti-sigma regulatory factor (Ser/Thr protein kinase) [Streptacidiphilus sp. MAP12-20]|uniref:ATP-binding SpoIIE family protein phosphatase n=1 Tax=Streptacidiphilus sp. MAP12-20 TaxID=3156299 RepID=UPI0035146220